MNSADLFFKLLIPIFLLLATISHTARGKLIVIENATHLYSDHKDINYPKNNETLDVIWLFRHSIRLNINKFHLNGHSGDFVLLSDLPLLNAQNFKNTSGESYLDELASSILTDQGILLSWKVNKTFEVISNRGTFILFHSEAKNPSWQADFEGFDIDVVNYDDTVPTTTTEEPVPPADANGKETYITKYLDCKSPIQFIRELDDFKEKIAQLATTYCNQTEIPACLDKGSINKSEVSIPDAKQPVNAGLHYCDLSWPNYDTCVQVTFAITRLDVEGNYVLPMEQLEMMWAIKSNELVKHGYCPYDPPQSLVDLNTIVWIAFFLGIMLALTGLLAFAWVMNTRAIIEYRRSFMQDKGRKEMGKQIFNDDSHAKNFATDDPIYRILQKTVHRDDHDQLYPSKDYLEGIGGNAVTSPFRKRSTDNPTYEDANADVHAYDNSAYEQEEQLGPLPTVKEGETKVFMRPRTSHASLSDTEI